MCERQLGCMCNCHKFPGTKHFVACCDKKAYEQLSEEEKQEINPLLEGFLKKSRL